jgi:uncharacterized protein
VRVLRAHAYRRMPWKNGGGETAEIAVFPEGAGASDFLWRASMATITTDGPFSAFPHVDRTLSILEGDGVLLSVGDRAPIRIGPCSRPCAFPGDVPTSVRLVGGPVLDLNIMTRRTRFAHSMRRIAVSRAQEVALAGHLCVIFCARGVLTILTNGFSARLGRLDSLVGVPADRAVLQGRGAGLIISLQETGRFTTHEGQTRR